MKIKNKGKVYPSPSSSSSSSSSSSAICSSPNRDVLSVLNLLPVAILALTSILSLEDREVLAYLITRSLQTTTTTTTTTTNPSSLTQDSKKKSSKKLNNNNNNSNHNNSNGGGGTHKPPIFECDCFDCYTSYWYRWDSSLNRELIHQAIEAFEDHLSHGELSKKPTNGKSKRRDKTTRRLTDKPIDFPAQPEISVPETSSPETEEDSCATVVSSLENDLDPVTWPEQTDGVEDEALEVTADIPESAEMAVVVRTIAAASSHKGLARKVLPDVIGLLNSRLWSLWSPNV